MTELLNILKDFSPFATIALALVIIYQMYQQKNGKSKVSAQLDDLVENHLHLLPEINRTLQRIEEKLNILDEIKTDIKLIKQKR